MIFTATVYTQIIVVAHMNFFLEIYCGSQKSAGKSAIMLQCCVFEGPCVEIQQNSNINQLVSARGPEIAI